MKNRTHQKQKFFHWIVFIFLDLFLNLSYSSYVGRCRVRIDRRVDCTDWENEVDQCKKQNCCYDDFFRQCYHKKEGSCNLGIKERNKCSNSDIPSKKCKKKGCCYDEWLQQCYKPEKHHHEAEVITEEAPEDHNVANAITEKTPSVVETTDDTYDVFENWAKKGDFPNQPEPHPCDRVCRKGQNMICRYTFVLELHTSMGKPCYECPRKDAADCFRPHCVTADGFARGIVVVNRTMPGPPVVVCKGDQIIVTVINKLHSATATLHFHGEHFKNGDQYFDGVPFITQCPILPGSKFQYRWTATVPGTNWYHSHVAFQRGDGLLGMYIVRLPPDEEAHIKSYDYDLTDHHIVAQEWFHGVTAEQFLLMHWDGQKGASSGIVINGRGRYFEDSLLANPMYKKFRNTTTDYADFNPFEKSFLNFLPMASFYVTSGKRYRFRIMNPGFTICPIRMTIDHHSMIVIGTDSSSIKPKKVKSLVIFPGERYDFILHANKGNESSCKSDCGETNTEFIKYLSEGIFRIRFTGYLICSFFKVHQEALLIYNKRQPGSKMELAVDRRVSAGKLTSIKPKSLEYQSFLDDKKNRELMPMLNPLNYAPHDGMNFTEAGFVSFNELESCLNKDCLPKLDEALASSKPDSTYYIAFDSFKRAIPRYHHPEYYPFNNTGVDSALTPQINNITFIRPPSPPLSQFVDENLFCDENSFRNTKDCSKEYCECVHRIKIKLNDIVELILIDEGTLFEIQHPIHIHGYSPYIVAYERHAKDPIFSGIGGTNSISKEYVRKLNEEGKIKRNLINPPQKDTIAVPDAGFAIMRFKADNPGLWFVHCHFAWHNHIGMGFVIQVGEKNHHHHLVEKPPPKNFPKCGNFGW